MAVWTNPHIQYGQYDSEGNETLPLGYQFGYQYMLGNVSIDDVQGYILHHNGNAFGFKDKMLEVREGISTAIWNGVAIPARVQPEQDQTTLEACSGYQCYLQNGECILSRRVKKFSKSSFQTTLGECLKIKDGWKVYERSC